MKAIYDFKGHKIGDSVAAAYCLQALHLSAAAEGAPRVPIGVINRGMLDVSTYFPDVADEFCSEAHRDGDDHATITQSGAENGRGSGK